MRDRAVSSPGAGALLSIERERGGLRTSMFPWLSRGATAGLGLTAAQPHGSPAAGCGALGSARRTGVLIAARCLTVPVLTIV